MRERRVQVSLGTPRKALQYLQRPPFQLPWMLATGNEFVEILGRDLCNRWPEEVAGRARLLEAFLNDGFRSKLFSEELGGEVRDGRQCFAFDRSACTNGNE